MANTNINSHCNSCLKKLQFSQIFQTIQNSCLLNVPVQRIVGQVLL